MNQKEVLDAVWRHYVAHGTESVLQYMSELQTCLECQEYHHNGNPALSPPKPLPCPEDTWWEKYGTRWQLKKRRQKKRLQEKQQTTQLLIKHKPLTGAETEILEKSKIRDNAHDPYKGAEMLDVIHETSLPVDIWGTLDVQEHPRSNSVGLRIRHGFYMHSYWEF